MVAVLQLTLGPGKLDLGYLQDGYKNLEGIKLVIDHFRMLR